MSGLDVVFQFGELNWLAVFVAAMASFVVGGVWYNSQGKMGKIWLKENNFSKKQMKQAQTKEAMTGHIAITFFVNISQSILLALVLNALGIVEATEGLLFGALCGMIWAAGSLAINNVYALKTLRLYAVDAGYIVAYFTVMGLILGAWQ